MLSSNSRKVDENQRPRTPTLPFRSISNVAKGGKGSDDADHWPSAPSPAPAAQNDLRRDLHQIGYESNEVDEMMNHKETGFDSFASPRRSQRAGPSIVPQHSPSNSKLPKRKEKRLQIVLGDDDNWVLFDCLEPFPAFGTGKGPPPSVFTQYARYVPGNARVVEYNIATGSLRIKSTPRSLQGMTVEYTSEGPRLLDGEDTHLDSLSAVRKPAASRGSRGGNRGGGGHRGRGSRVRGFAANPFGATTRPAPTTRQVALTSASASPAPAGSSSSPLSSPEPKRFEAYRGRIVAETPEGSHAGSEDEDEVIMID